MNKINPIYLVSLLVVIAFFAYFKTNQMQENLNKLVNANADTEVLATSISSYKSVWDDADKKLDSIIRNSSFKSVKFDKQYKQNLIQLKAENLDQNTLKNLTNKLLNGYLEIKSLSIDLQETKVSLVAEIVK